MDIAKLAAALHPLERRVLPLLQKHSAFLDIVSNSGLSEVEVMRALQWLENKKIVEQKAVVREFIELASNGRLYLKECLPERRFAEAVRDYALSLADVEKKALLSGQELSASLGVLKQKAAVESRDGKFTLTEHGKKLFSKDILEESFLKLLEKTPLDAKELSDEEKFAFSNLKKRKDIVSSSVRKERSFTLTGLGMELSKLKLQDNSVDSLTPKMLKSGSWKDKEFRRYDVSINVPGIHGGRRHFVNQAIEYIRRVWLDLGFTEMEGNMVQTAFWDLDSLFVPQDHPARDMQDTFYIKDPKYGRLPKTADVVKKTHESGWTTGSLGWRYNWSSDLARENMLRTHTTVLSARTIAGLKKSDLPAKFFSVKKVFRNESVSWKNLFEFVQVEGIVVDPSGNFMNLKGYLKVFFSKMGFEDVRIRPGHFPYTEPSAEVDVWHPEKKAWVELGGSGIFRPEVTKPLIGEEIPVLAWGLGLERSIMEYYKIGDVRNLYSNDLKQLREIKLWMR